MLFTMLIAVAGLILFALSSSGIYNEYGTQESIHVLEVYSRMYEAGGETTQEAAEALSEKLGVRVTFISEEGMVISDSEIASLAGQYHGDRPEFVDAQKNGTGYDMRKSDSAGHNTIYYCTKVGDVYLRLGLDELASGGLFMKILPTLLWLVAMETLLCMLCAYLSTSFILKPIKECVKKAALNEKIETKYPELEPIAEMMNKMNADIAEKISEINAEKEQVIKATASKNDFIANITHEMNTPLTSIRGFAELLQNDLPEEQKKRALDTIVKQSERLSNLVACVINYNQLDNDDLPPYEVNLSKIVKETADILKPDMEKRNLTLSLEVEEDVIVISRHERIIEVVGNLLRNAIKYNKDNGIIIVVVSGGDVPKLIVRDTGIGVSEENKEKIFDRFFTVDKSHGGKHGGFGLGLATVKKICRISGWKLSCDSKLNVGTAFTIEFCKKN